ncbi:MAG: mannose-1-phosphate guanylyltransferase [Bacteroidaceae bacterium]|nr:mannose-1-phosphate guanylyltransferase [Bacteroidaceae bacterium]
MKNNTYCVIMAGGVGNRLWPLSRKNLPKQFLDFYNTGRSLLQQTFDRYNKIVVKEHIYVVTNTEYVELIKEQLPEMPPQNVLAEPTRRNTAPCMAWATYHIHAIDPDANIVFTPSDHLILSEEKFIHDIDKGFHYVDHHNRLLCIGIRPHRAETRYGYIQVGENDGENFFDVKTFTEKPEQELAEVFLESGEFYWNAGIFLGKAHTIMDAFRHHAPELAANLEGNGGLSLYGTDKEKKFIEKYFPACPNIPIEYGILEKSENVYVMTCDFGWSDIGTWSTYYDTLPKDEQGNVRQRKKVLLYDCDNCFVGTRESEKIIVVQGLENYLVADTEDVLLICPKDNTNMLRKIINDAQIKMGEKFV